jgi:acyl transferase domain-containing protein/trans-aconitate methyltransferase/acyl carrier protein
MPDTEPTNRAATAVKRALAMIQDLEAKLAKAEQAARAPIAVVGIGCRFPGDVSNAAAYWRLLNEGRDTITEVPASRWDLDAYYDPDPDKPGKTNSRWGGFLSDVDLFDAALFGIARREAEAMDPQHRLLLETAWEALEDAGIAPDGLIGRQIGVFVGLSTSDYGTLLGAGRDESWIDAYAALGNAPSIAAGRLAYAFGTQGPAMMVDTACSSSLTSVHLAVQALRAGECGTALAAGVNLTLSPALTINFSKARMLAADGRCKTFDAGADGYVRGEGCGVVVLKRLTDAEAGGDRVLAVIRGTAVNQDGRSAGLTAPNGPAQEAVIRAALANAGLSPDAVDAIEAHGTGTSLGDPIEMHALAAVFAGRSKPLRVGSVKTNIGHTEAAAGIAGLIKAVLMLRHQTVPASLHFRTLNPHIDLAGVPIEVPTTSTAAELGCVGVSSFGFSGTNAHVVLERAPSKTVTDPRPAHLLTLSTRDPAALEQLRSRWLEALTPTADFAALARSAAGRARLPQRLAVVAADAAAARTALSTAAASVAGRPRVAFLCTGQGSTYAGMAAGLMDLSPAFRSVVERCDAVMGLDRPLAQIFNDGALLARTDYAQPALYALSAGLGALWWSWGIEPVAVLGHSVGEYAAAHLAGVLSLEDGARLIATRGRLMQALPAGGGMAALLGNEASVRSLLARHPEVEVAGLNSPMAMTVAGPVAAIDRLLADPALSSGMAGQKLTVLHAFHSKLLEPMLDELAAAANQVAHGPATVPVVGNLDGSVVAKHDGAYWRAHARQPVRFAAGLQTLAQMGCTHLVELGAQPILSGFARNAHPAMAALPSLTRPRPNAPPGQAWVTLMDAAARLWRDGAPIDGLALNAPFPAAPTDAPTYPFQRQRYWLPDPTLEPARETMIAPVVRPVSEIGDKKVTGFYDELAQAAGHDDAHADGSEGHLTFGLMPAPQPGFSWLRAFFAGETSPEEYATLRRCQSALKQAIFSAVDFDKAKRVLDFGCGHAADLSAIASRHPHLMLDGCTISAGQVEVGRQRVARLGLVDRVRLHHRDSARDPFPGHYDVIFGVEVAGLIEDKQALFDNVARHLEPGGALVIADFLATTDPIASPDTASFTPTAEQWAELLATHGLRLTDCIDVSREIAQFLDDPGFAAEVDKVVARHKLSALTRTHLLSNDNIGRALRAGLMSYVLLTARGDRTTPTARLLSANRARLAAPDSWTSDEIWREWFYRIEWQPMPIDAAVERGRAALAPLGADAQAIDRLARAYVGTADLATAKPVPRMARLHAHLLRVGGSKEDPTTLSTPELPEARLLRRCGPRLRGVIEGRDDPLDALFGDGGTAAEALYAESPFARAVNEVAVAAIDALLQERRPTRIVEIGCGTGGTTKALLPRLRPGDRYLATDISPRFVAALQSKLGVEGATLDISRPVSEQGHSDGSADIVVAANVLHATPDLRATLANAVNLLAPGGALLLIENSGPLIWGDLTFGLTDGMWAFADTDLRPHHALPSPETWRTLIEELGLSAEIHKPGGDETAAVSGQFVVLARKPSSVPDRVWFAPAKADPAALIESAIAELRAAAAEPVPPRVWLVTQGGRAVTAGDAVEPAQAALWGLANGAAIEHPELRLSIIDSAHRDAALRLVRADGAETRLAWRDGHVYRARLERCTAPQQTARIRPDQTYLVTGGLAGVGLEVAKWLAASGAKSLALLGRTTHPVDGFAADVTVTQHICDVTDETALAKVLDQLKRERAPVAGIFHAAGVLDDAMLAQQTPKRVATVLGPKLTGATLLDRLTRDLPIEHFVLFSSSAALLGSAGQVNHSAANACLDALAERRRTEGLPAVSICWGAWAEVGAAARAGTGVARRGLQPMPPQEALAALSHAMTAKHPVIGILAVDWARFLDRFPAGTRPPLFSSVEPVAAKPSLPAGQPVAAAPVVQSLALQLERAEPAARPDVLLLYIRETTARILGLQGELPPADAPLREVGLDSLMTVELRNALASACETRLPATLVFENPTCQALADHLGRTVFAALWIEAEPADELDSMNADELADLLAKELGAADAQLEVTR